MKPVSLQIALFFQDVYNRPDNLIGKLPEKVSKLFDNIPMVIPIPNDAPAEIPVVQLSSLNGQYKLNIARTRADFFIATDINSNDSLDKIISDSTGMINTISSFFYENMPLNRIGVSTNVFIEDNNGIKRILEKYFKNNFIEEMVELSFSKNSLKNVNSALLNNITNISYVELSNSTFPNVIKKGIMISRDINNRVISLVLSKNLIDDIITYALKQFKSSVIKELI